MDPKDAVLKMLRGLGFESVSQSRIVSGLSKIQPYGETALNDSILAGVDLILKLNAALAQLGYSQAWNFVHIVITDGVDTVSRTSLEQLMAIFLRINATIPSERILTVLIGVDLSVEAALELSILKQIGGENCMIFNVNNVRLNEVFSRISATLGVQTQTAVGIVNAGNVSAMRIQQTNRPVLNIRRNNFAVLLNLDISGSMNGQRFNSLKNSVGMFMNSLSPTDIASCIVFSDRVQFLHTYNPPVRDYDSSGVQVIRCANQ